MRKIGETFIFIQTSNSCSVCRNPLAFWVSIAELLEVHLQQVVRLGHQDRRDPRGPLENLKKDNFR